MTPSSSLTEIIAGILCSIADAQQQVDEYASRRLAPAYQREPLLQGAPVPRAALQGLELELHCLLDKTGREASFAPPDPLPEGPLLGLAGDLTTALVSRLRDFLERIPNQEALIRGLEQMAFHEVTAQHFWNKWKENRGLLLTEGRYFNGDSALQLSMEVVEDKIFLHPELTPNLGEQFAPRQKLYAAIEKAFRQRINGFSLPDPHTPPGHPAVFVHIGTDALKESPEALVTTIRLKVGIDHTHNESSWHLPIPTNR